MLKELINLRNDWILLMKTNPHAGPIFQHCINDLDKAINRKLIPENSKIEHCKDKPEPLE